MSGEQGISIVEVIGQISGHEGFDIANDRTRCGKILVPQSQLYSAGMDGKNGGETAGIKKAIPRRKA